MSELESVIKLRAWLDCKVKKFDFEHGTIVLNRGVNPNDLYYLADEIEREVSERFVELPVDADGVPIHVGDYIKGPRESDPIIKVTGVAQNEFHGPMLQTEDAITGGWYCVTPGTVHCKSRTIEDVLDEFLHTAADACAKTNCELEEQIAKYTAELRGMMEADDD